MDIGSSTATEQKKDISGILLIIFGIINFAVLCAHIFTFAYPTWMEIDAETYYVGTNIVSAGANLLYFTYWSLIITSAWAVLYGLTRYFRPSKIKSFCENKYVMLFIALYEIIVAAIYTVFELTSGEITFGLFALTPYGFYGLFENLYIHYAVSSITVAVIFIKLKNSRFEYKKSFLFTIIPLVYYAVAFVFCNYLLPIKWSPYPIFNAKVLLQYIGLQYTPNLFLSILIIFSVVLVFVALFLGICILTMYLFNRNFPRGGK